MATIGELNIKIGGDIKNLERALGRAEARLRRSGRKLASIGSELTQSISVPILAIGVGAVKLATDFEESMTKISSQVGIAVDEVKEMQKGVLSLAGQTARAPKELADAMFFIQSAGQRGSQALETLEFSAKAAAIGLGETKVIADVVTASIEAYGKEALNAEQSTDILLKTVELGKAEAEGLAAAFGSILPTASALEVELKTVGGALAAMSKTNSNTNEIATQFNAILTTFQKEVPATRDILTKLGTSYEEVRQQIKDKGLLATLADLKTSLKDQGIQTSELFRNNRALKGMLALTGNNLETNIEIMKEMENATGGVNEAFKITSMTARFQFDKALAQLKASGILLGTTLLPIATSIADKVSKAAQAFSGLSEGTQRTIIKIAGFAAAIGPAIFVLGKMKLAIAAILGALKAAFSLSSLSALMNPWTLAIVGIIALGVLVVKNWDVVKKAIIKVTNSVIDLYNNFLPLRYVVANLKFTFQTLWKTIKFVLSNTLKGFNALFRAIMQGLSGDFSKAGETIKNAFNESMTGIKSLGKDVAKDFTDGLEEVMNGRIAHIGEGAFKTLEGKASGVKDIIKGIMDGLTDDSDNKKKKKLKKISDAIDLGEGTSGILNTFQQLEEGKRIAEEALQGVQPLTAEITRLGEAASLLPPIMEPVNNSFSKFKDLIFDLKDLMSEMAESVSKSLQNLAMSGVASFSKLGKAALSAAADVLRANIIKGVSSAIEKTLSFLPPPFNLIAAGAAGAAAGILFNKAIKSLNIPAFAKGTDFAPGGLALVGERGPELLNIPRGAKITPNHKLGSMGGDTKVIAKFNLTADGLLVLIEEAQRQRVRSGII